MNLFKNLKPKASVSKNGFDLSQKHVFSSVCGRIDSPLQVETVPGDYFEIDMNSLHRSMTMNTAAFIRGKFRYDFFFVPYSQLWHPFNQFISQREDIHSMNQKGSSYCPVVHLYDVLKTACDCISNNRRQEQDLYGFNVGWNMLRQLDMLGYGNHYIVIKELFTAERYDDIQTYIEKFLGKYVNVFRAAAYQHIWYDVYRNKYFDTYDANYDTVKYAGRDYIRYFNFDDINCGNSTDCILDSSDDARIAGIFGQRYAPWKKDLFTGCLPGQQFGVVSSVMFESSLSGLTTYTDEAEYNGLSRSEIYEDFPPGGVQNRGYAYPETVNGIPFITDSEFSMSRGQAVSIRTPHTHGVDLSNQIANGSFDVLSLRKAEMLQIWKERTLRAGNMTDDQFNAHYGVTPYYDSDENVNFLGSFEASLMVNAVESTSSTDNSVNGRVGDLGATGTAVGAGHKIKFDCRDFGVIMCMAYFVPETEYNANMIDKHNRLFESFDFFTPEFQNLGFEAIQNVDYDVLDADSSGFNRVIGYAPRYWSYKQAVDKIHGEFGSTYFGYGQERPFAQGSLTAWVAPRYIVRGNEDSSEPFEDVYHSLASLYVNPNTFDTVFGVNYDGAGRTDTFLNNVYFDIKAIRPMSVLGLPSF